MKRRFTVDREQIADYCRQNGIRSFALFGSVLTDRFGPADRPARRHVGMEIELSGILGRKADMRTAKDLSRYFRDEVVASAEVQYAEG
jgi:uncharacterized protein